MRWIVTIAATVFHLGAVFTLPPSLVEDVKANELKQNNKVKRAFTDETPSEVAQTMTTYYNNPSAIKRGADQLFSDWQEDKSKDSYSDISSDLYSNDDASFDAKSRLPDFDKNYQYNMARENLDEALENAILRSEFYKDPSPSNQYRYYDDQFEERKRKRREAKSRVNNRYKRNIDLSPEEWLALLQIWENDRRRSQKDSYRPIWSTYEPNRDSERERDENDLEDEDENWLEAPVYPHITRVGELTKNNPNYMYEDKRGQWDGFAESKNTRFGVAKKRKDPTRELRYLNGPAKSKNEFYTLSQLLANQREPSVPVYHRLVL